jgi:hypothetical protein
MLRMPRRKNRKINEFTRIAEVSLDFLTLLPHEAIAQILRDKFDFPQLLAVASVVLDAAVVRFAAFFSFSSLNFFRVASCWR